MNKKKENQNKKISIKREKMKTKKKKYSKYAKKQLKIMAKCNKYFKKSIKLNYKFFTVLIILTIFFSLTEKNEIGEKNTIIVYIFKIFIGFFSLVLAIITSYKVHVCSHYSIIFNFFKEMFGNKTNKTKTNKTKTLIEKIWHYFLIYLLKFHSEYHHDSDINKIWYNLIIEGIQNVLNCGGLIIIILFLLNFKFKILNNTYLLNYNVILLWALGYSTYHLINYQLKEKGHPHENHHKEPFKNFGPDFIDILYNTKYDFNNLDNINDGIYNLILISIFLLLIRQFKQYIF